MKVTNTLKSGLIVLIGLVFSANLWAHGGAAGTDTDQCKFELEPDHLEATWDLAMLDMEMGNFESAANGFKVCVHRNPEMYKGYFFLATCLKSMDKPEEALEQYRTFLPLTSDSVLQKKVGEIINRLEVNINVVSDPNE